MTSPSALNQEHIVAVSGLEGFVEEPSPTYFDQVLIPSGRPYTHAYLGPLPNSLESEEIQAIFPSHSKLKPRIFAETPFHFECLKNPNRVFRSAPRVEQNDYIAWLNKIEGQKGVIWQEQGIFDIIQLSRYGPKYDSTMLLAALQFWDATTHSLHLKCGMLSPTLFDVAAITGLKPLGETFDPKQSTQEYGFSFDNATFGAYIADHHDTENSEVSDLEHIAFLTLWLSCFVFCSRSLQVAKVFIPLANQLHETRNINLAKLILGHLYLHLDNAALELKEDEPTDKFLIAGPMWLMQLWLLATFESRLNLVVPKDVQPTLEARRTEGIRLAQLRNREKNLPYDEMFSMYFDIFFKCKTFVDAMAPFVRCSHGPPWFTSEFPSNSAENAEEINQIWRAYLSPSLLSTRLSPSSNKNNLVIHKYFPSYFSRQFGLCQLRPAPVCLHRREFNSPENEREYQQAFKKFHYRDLTFEPAKFQPRFSCTKKFQDWWSDYYNKAFKGRTKDDLINKLFSALPSQIAQEGTKGTHSVEI